jgi:hypothetical protein
LSKKYAQYIHLQRSLAIKSETETKCWKTCFYSLIEKFRKSIKAERSQSSDSHTILNIFYDLLDKTESFYKLLIVQIDTDSEKARESRKMLRWSKCVDCLGDISRYRWIYSLDNPEVRRDSLADTASIWYLMGIKLNPINGMYQWLQSLLGCK